MIPATRKLAEKIRSTERRVDIQRALIVTRVYQATEDEAIIIRRAKALASVLSEMDIRINEGELIVGNQARQPKAGPFFPEYAQDWILAQMFAGGASLLGRALAAGCLASACAFRSNGGNG